MIRLANDNDAAAVAAIYGPYVEHSHFTFEEEAPLAAEMAARPSVTATVPSFKPPIAA